MLTWVRVGLQGGPVCSCQPSVAPPNLNRKHIPTSAPLHHICTCTATLHWAARAEYLFVSSLGPANRRLTRRGGDRRKSPGEREQCGARGGARQMCRTGGCLLLHATILLHCPHVSVIYKPSLNICSQVATLHICWAILF